MIDLDSQKWSQLQHAYGVATDTPALLRELASQPADGGNSEPWLSLWSSLAHQGDVYSASFAAVPHVVAALAGSPSTAAACYYQFPAWVEICRVRQQMEIPSELSAPYFEALARLPELVAAASGRLQEPGFLACALSAIAASAGHIAIAEAILELSSDKEAEEFLEWRIEQ